MQSHPALRILPFWLAIASVPLSAQSQPTAEPPLRFDVASIHPHEFAGDEPSNRRVFPGGRFVATATPLRTLLRIALGVDARYMSGAPGWVDSERFDITATTAGHADVKTPQQLQQLMLSLLEDRFQLKFHREQKPGSVYWLELDKPGKTGRALRPSGPESQPNMSTNTNGPRSAMKISKMTMADVASVLSRQVGRPVEDHTSLTGSYDFEIEWAPEETPDSVDPSLHTVLKEQLGLKLQPERGSIEIVVIDRIAHPTAN
jgi:uncharacterized protein (TIGR03435 family)